MRRVFGMLLFSFIVFKLIQTPFYTNTDCVCGGGVGVGVWVWAYLNVKKEASWLCVFTDVNGTQRILHSHLTYTACVRNINRFLSGREDFYYRLMPVASNPSGGVLIDALWWSRPLSLYVFSLCPLISFVHVCTHCAVR